MSKTGNPLSAEDLERTFGPTAEISDELAEQLDQDLGIVEPLPDDEDDYPPLTRAAPAAPNKALTRSVLFFALSVLALVAVQTAEIVLKKRQPEASVPVAPEPVAGPNEGQLLNAVLRDARVRLDYSLYEDVVGLLEPYADDPQMFSDEQRFSLYLMLARAYRRLGNAQKAQQFTLRATDQAVERRAPADLFAYSRTLRDERRHEEARRQYASVLARSDGLTDDQRVYRELAQIRLADTFLEEARTHKELPALPGAYGEWSDPGKPGSGRP